MRFVRKDKLEGFLGEIPKQSVSLFGYSLVYGKADRDLTQAEDRERARKNYMDYFELCRMGAFCHPTPSTRFTRMPPAYD